MISIEVAFDTVQASFYLHLMKAGRLHFLTNHSTYQELMIGIIGFILTQLFKK